MKISITKDSINAKALNAALHRHGVKTLPKDLSKLTTGARHSLMQVIRDDRYCSALIGKGKFFETKDEAQSANGWRKLDEAVKNDEIAIVPARKAKKPQAPAIAKEASTEERLARLCDLLIAGKITEEQFVAMSSVLAIK